MTDALPSSTGVLAAWYSYFWLGGEDWDLTTTGPCEAGLITPTAASDGVLIDTATAAGYFRVTLQYREDEPPAPTEEWEDVVRGSLPLSTAAIYALPTAADGDYIELPLPKAGLYGFQVSGKGRVPSDSLDRIDPDEQYLIDVWPITQPIAPTIVKATSARIAERLAFP